MANTKNIRKTVEEFTKNPHWKKYYEQAPSDGCKQHIALTFYSSFYGESADIKQRKVSLEADFTITDWQYLYDNAGNNPFKTTCKQKIEDLS